MSDEEIKSGIDKYKELVELKKEIETLKMNSVVKRYLQLSKYELEDKCSEDLILDSFSPIGCNTSNSNQILVYIGKYLFTKDEFGEIFDKHNISTFSKTMHEYRDLETTTKYHVISLDKKKFEQEHTVIYLLRDQNIFDTVYVGSQGEYGLYSKLFNDVRKTFFTTLVTMSQSDAVKELIYAHRMK